MAPCGAAIEALSGLGLLLPLEAGAARERDGATSDRDVRSLLLAYRLIASALAIYSFDESLDSLAAALTK